MAEQRYLGSNDRMKARIREQVARDQAEMAEREALISERDRARELVVRLESAVAERDAMLRDARALMRHGAECQLLVTRWVWDTARQQSFCRACRAAYNVEKPGHHHGCDCGRDSLVARIDALVGGESHE